jgi:DNA invertase Pin-like site-specific DNA recombinase
MKKCLELLRVSTLGQADADRASLPSQRTVNRQTAERYGLTIVRTIEMAGVSGAAVLFAPEMQEMIRLMQDASIHGVITREFSRLMRPENFADYALLQSFVDSNTVLYLPEGPIDFSSDSGMILGTVHATLGGIERKQMKKKLWAAREEKRRNKELGGSRVILPYGVTYPWAFTADAEKVREVFRLFLSGQTNYAVLSKILGVTVPGVKAIMRNPIYTGWRVIDKKRDMSMAGLYPTKNGRQGDRRKVQRLPEEVIRVRIEALEPLISEHEFAQVQKVMDLKRQNSWRHQEGYQHRSTYNGYINCTCGSMVYTKYRHGDYYVCRDRCGVRYMRRDRLEPALNKLFSQTLTKPAFLKRHILAPLGQKRQSQGNSELLRGQLASLEGKRKRILDGYFEGVITATERDQRIGDVDRELHVISSLLAKEAPPPDLTLETLVDVFAPFVEFDLLNRDDKRRLLNTLAPTIVASNYKIEGLWIGLDGGNNESHADRGLLIAAPRRFYLRLEIAA